MEIRSLQLAHLHLLLFMPVILRTKHSPNITTSSNMAARMNHSTVCLTNKAFHGANAVAAFRLATNWRRIFATMKLGNVWRPRDTVFTINTRCMTSYVILVATGVCILVEHLAGLPVNVNGLRGSTQADMLSHVPFKSRSRQDFRMGSGL